MFSLEREKAIEKRFESLIKTLGNKGLEIEKRLKDCTEDEKITMKFLYTTMPLSDIGCYSFDIFLDYAKQGVFLWYNNKYNIPEDIFLNYVLHYRVNEEEIEPCRTFFYDKLKDRIANKSIKDAIIEVNYWCSQEATYQSTDERTVSAITVYKSAYGRCGEESTFTVSAFRSVGIPARQVYAPRWSHCDDNHAWVEVYIDGIWYFLGACEPEEILNKGWFTNASSRAMLIHSRWFDFEDCKEEKIEKQGMVWLINQLPRYAITKKLTVKVVDLDNKPVEKAIVNFEVLNYSELYPVASSITNSDGIATITTGLGTFNLHIFKDNMQKDILVNTKKEDFVTINIQNHNEIDKWLDFEIIAPIDAPINSNQPTKEQKELCKEKTKKATEFRLKKIDILKDSHNILDIARGNKEEIKYFYNTSINNEADSLKDELLNSLTIKDYRDCKGEVLLEHLEYTYKYANKYNKNIFVNYILSPRINNEPLTSYCKFINNYYNEDIKEQMANNPKYIWKWIKENIKTDDNKEYPNLITTPVGALEVKTASLLSKKILFVAICRALGIPAKINKIDNKIQYFKDNKFIFIQEDEIVISKCVLQKEDKEDFVYYQDFTIAKLNNNVFKTLDLTKTSWEDNKIELNLEVGKYRIITSNRLPNGNIFAKVIYIHIKENEEKYIKLELKEAKLNDMLEKIDILDFELKGGISAKSINKHDKNLFIWLEESKEPTEHILNEIYDKKELFIPLKDKINFIIKNENALQDPTFKKVLNVLGDCNIYYDDFEENINTLGRRMYVDFEKLPLIIVTNKDFKGIYATSGYNVGTGDMLLRIFNS